jgi:hypothetical protein
MDTRAIMPLLRALLGMHLFRALQLPKLVAFLPQFMRVFWRLLHDPRVPLSAKLVPFFLLFPLVTPPALRLYLVPALGLLGWVVLGTIAMKVFIWMCPPDVVREHVARVARGG